MKKILLGMTALAIFMSSCTKNDKSDPIIVDPPMSAWYITGVIGTEVDGNSGAISVVKDSMVISYNADKTFSSLEEIEGTYYQLIKLVYDQLKVSKVTSQSSKAGDAKTRYEVRYAGDNIVRIFEPGKADVQYDSLVYDNNKLVKVVHVEADKRSNRQFEYTWTNNNVTEEKEYRPDQTTGEFKLSFVRKYAYNNAPNLLKPLSNYGLMGGDAPNVLTFSANEVVSRTVTMPDGSVMDTYTWSRSVSENKLTLTDTLRKNNKITYIQRYTHKML